MPFRKALVMVTQYVCDGASKVMSEVVAEKGLPRLTWSEFGLSSSPKPVDELERGRDQKWVRSPGEKVRFIDLILPRAEEGGIIDCPPHCVDTTQFSAATVEKMEKGFPQHYGHLMPSWINLLLSHDYSSRLIELQDLFARKMAAGELGWDKRHAGKFGALYAVGTLAVEKGLLPWSKAWPQKAVSSCYTNAVRVAQGEDGLVKKALERLLTVASDPRRIVAVEALKPGAIPVINKSHAGITTTHKKLPVTGILERSLVEIAGDKPLARALIAQLKALGAYTRGHGNRGTTQIGIPMIIDGKRVEKPRFWLIDHSSLRFSLNS
jgi:hypothetical protein